MPITGRIEAITLVEGTPVEKGQVVAQIVPRDLELAVAAGHGGRAAARGEHQARTPTSTSRRPPTSRPLQFVKSTTAAVQAAAERMTAGKAKLDYADRDLGRVRRLAATGAETQDDLEQATLDQVQSDVDYKQDQLVHAAMVAIGAATDLMPIMVRQYIDRKRLTGAVLEKAEGRGRGPAARRSCRSRSAARCAARSTASCSTG